MNDDQAKKGEQVARNQAEEPFAVERFREFFAAAGEALEEEIEHVGLDEVEIVEENPYSGLIDKAIDDFYASVRVPFVGVDWGDEAGPIITGYVEQGNYVIGLDPPRPRFTEEDKARENALYDQAILRWAAVAARNEGAPDGTVRSCLRFLARILRSRRKD